MYRRIAVVVSSIAASLVMNVSAFAQSDTGGQPDNTTPQGPGQGVGPGPGQGPASGQGPGGRFGRRQFSGANGAGTGGGNPDFAARRQRMLEKFDTNHDGVLSDDERAKMRAFMQQRRQERMQRMQQGLGSGQGFGPPGDGPRSGGPPGGGPPGLGRPGGGAPGGGPPGGGPPEDSNP